MTPATPEAMRTSLDARIQSQAAAAGLDPNRLRRRLVFQRLLRRLEPDGRWVLKGGYLLEARIEPRARATKDLDLVVPPVDDVDELIDDLAHALSSDPDEDFFKFSISQVRPLETDPAGRGGWRLSVSAQLAGRTFSDIRVDVLERIQDVSGATEKMYLESPVTGLDFRAAHVVAVDVAQHAAEKFHALCRTYSGDRPNSRVKDLLDIVLLVEAGLLPDEKLPARLVAVFDVRDGRPPPDELPALPAAWTRDYLVLADDTKADTRDFDAAFETAARLYSQSL